MNLGLQLDGLVGHAKYHTESYFLPAQVINNKQLPGRVADVILYFYELFHRSNTFEFPLSREELAQFSGTTKESFIRTLAEFKNDKIIITDGKNITINSMEIVKTLSRLG